MEKEPQPDSLPPVTMKGDYPPSEAYSSEPPPAYHRPKSSAVQVAKIVAVTVVVVSVILGGFWLASSYIQARSSCKHLEQELEFLLYSMDRMQPNQPEALIQEEPQQFLESNQITEKSTTEASTTTSTTPAPEKQEKSSEEDSSEEEPNAPLEDFLNRITNVFAGSLANEESPKMNCIRERQIIHNPDNPMMLKGERVVVVCKNAENNPFAPQQALPQTPIPTKFVRQQSVVLIPRPQPQQQPPQPEPQTIPNQSMEEPQQNEEPNGLLNFIIQHIIAQNLQREAQLTEEKPPRVDAEPNYGFMFRPNQRVNPEISDNKMNMEEDSAPQMNRWPQMNRGMGVLIAVPSQNGNDRMPEGMNVPQPEVPKAPYFQPTGMQEAAMEK